MYVFSVLPLFIQGRPFDRSAQASILKVKYQAQGPFRSASHDRKIHYRSLSPPTFSCRVQRFSLSGHVPTFKLLLMYFKASVRRLFYLQIYVMCKCIANLQGNQWFLLGIAPTQTVASCAIIINLRSFASRARQRQCTAGGKQRISPRRRPCTCKG